MSSLEQLTDDVARAILKAHDDLYTDDKSMDLYMLQKEHSGDCTKQPWTCNKCYADMYRRQARAATLAVLRGVMEPGEKVLAAAMAETATDLKSEWQAMLNQLIAEIENE